MLADGQILTLWKNDNQKEITQTKRSPELCVWVQPKTVPRLVFKFAFVLVVELNLDSGKCECR